MINDFHSELIKKFFNDYIEENLGIYQSNINKENFNEFNYLNFINNLNDIIKEDIKTIINDYENITINHINFLHQKNIDKLDELFIFSNIQNTINKEIDNFYNSLLLPILKEKVIYNSGDANILDFDLSDLILNDINLFINEKINQTKQIIDKMKGNYFNIDISILNIPDFSLIKIEQILSIKNSFNNFIEEHNLEKLEFNKILLETIKNNFKNRVENFISSFGQDFFNKILKYNEIEKIKGLYDTLFHIYISIKKIQNVNHNFRNEIINIYCNLYL